MRVIVFIFSSNHTVGTQSHTDALLAALSCHPVWLTGIEHDAVIG